MKAQYILNKGRIIMSYLCDVDEHNNIKSNAGVENIIELDNKLYSVISNLDQTKAYSPNEIIKPIRN